MINVILTIIRVIIEFTAQTGQWVEEGLLNFYLGNSCNRHTLERRGRSNFCSK